MTNLDYAIPNRKMPKRNMLLMKCTSMRGCRVALDSLLFPPVLCTLLDHSDLSAMTLQMQLYTTLTSFQESRHLYFSVAAVPSPPPIIVDIQRDCGMLSSLLLGFAPWPLVLGFAGLGQSWVLDQSRAAWQSQAADQSRMPLESR